ncbi:hypothetical protein J3R30DRAFT_3283903 [Lentinula aciculospora]|uniref:Uncharacterized protein n=1 Tax=Lentinula aciculospora TaxID=153920 RepID=A0A9W9AIM7_9AGAR|nr:hypothetical protein J3R30DRAFT_3299375 [Lentinula aciculospora]KAJ4483654.1 hypothetical protein J3R30DRAFT_3283903 [Lentinula aciculospora]
MASWISFFLFHKPEDLLSESVSSALSKLAIQLDELPDTNVCLYKALGPTSLKDAERLSTNSSFVVSVAISPQPTLEAEVDLNAWYEEEHISLLSQVPGWQACRRFSLIDIKSTVNSAPPPRYLALHAYKHLDGFTTPQFKAAANTPWRTRVMKSIVARERHVYRLADE